MKSYWKFKIKTKIQEKLEEDWENFWTTSINSENSNDNSKMLGQIPEWYGKLLEVKEEKKIIRGQFEEAEENSWMLEEKSWKLKTNWKKILKTQRINPTMLEKIP